MEPVHPLDGLYGVYQSENVSLQLQEKTTSLATLWVLVLKVKPQQCVQQLSAQCIKEHLWQPLDMMDITYNKDHWRI